MANTVAPVVTYAFVFLAATVGSSKKGISPADEAKYLQWELYLRILESFYAHLVKQPEDYVKEALKLWTANGLLNMGNGKASRWGSVRVLSDNITRARQRLREAENDRPVPLPTPHKKALDRLAILMRQIGKTALPATNLPVIRGFVPLQPLLRLAPPTPVQQSEDDSEDSDGDEEFNGFSD